jgi:hypothetical protein
VLTTTLAMTTMMIPRALTTMAAVTALTAIAATTSVTSVMASRPAQRIDLSRRHSTPPRATLPPRRAVP